MAWFETWFDTPYYHILYQNHDFHEAEDFITKLTNYLHLPQKSKIIDLACGKGRHSIFLNKLGYDVLGLDLSKQSIEYDKQFENETLHFHIHDMREPFMGDKVDAVFNLFTSFGYFENDEDDKKVFNAVSSTLKKDGYFVLDYLNENFVRENLIEKSNVLRDTIDFKISKKIMNGYIVKQIDFEDNGKDYSFFEKVKLHTLEKINHYAEDAGFERVKVFGDYQLNDFDRAVSPRCINVFRKK